MWDSHLLVAAGDWNASSVLNTLVAAGQSRSRNCKPTAGRVEVCNSTYGNNGWLGIAQIWISGSHITPGRRQNERHLLQYRDVMFVIWA